MSVAATQSPSAAVFRLDSCSWTAPAECFRGEDDPAPAQVESGDEDRPAQFDVWSAIQSQKTAAGDHPAAAPYVHPLLRRSSSWLSQKSLETCTENLCSETGSDDFSSFVDGLDYFQDDTKEDKEEDGELVAAERGIWQRDGAQLMTTPVNFQCSNGRMSPRRSFPPPLLSLAQRNSPCLHMRPHRVDGRLVVEAVAVPSKNYLQAQRVDGRLLLSFTSTATFGSDALGQLDQSEGGGVGANETQNMTRTGENEDLEENNSCYDEEEEEEEDEEEVEVVDRGTVVEVKVSSQPQLQSGAMKVHRSLLVINKFIGGTPLNIGVNQTEKPTAGAGADDSQKEHNPAVQSAKPPRRAFPTTSTAAAAAVVAASTLSFTTESYSSERAKGGLWTPTSDHHPPPDNKLLFTSKRRNRDELLHNMRRCSQLRCPPLFIWEPCYIATSS